MDISVGTIILATFDDKVIIAKTVSVYPDSVAVHNAVYFSSLAPVNFKWGSHKIYRSDIIKVIDLKR